MNISAKQYAQTLFDLTRGQDETVVVGVIRKIVDRIKKNGHMRLSDDVITHFEKIYNNAHNIVTATVTTAFPLQAAQKDLVEQFIAREYDAKDVVTTFLEDASVKGGIIIRVEDEVIDASVNGKLKLIRNALVRS